MAFEVEDELRAVSFLCLERLIDGALRRTPVATAFFVSVDDIADRWAYLITARHVIENAESDDIWVRVNQTGRGFKEFRTKREDWSLHETADVAAILLTPNRASDTTLDMVPLSDQLFVSPDYRYRESPNQYDPGLAVAIGQEVYYVGLFTQHYGEERNLPIARFGNVSRMPHPVRLPRYNDDADSWFETIAYLAESHSWSGHSGSPAFVWFPIHIQKRSGGDFELYMGDEYIQVPALLGLVSAHYDVPRKAQVSGDVLGEITARHNSGIAVITPAHNIQELLLGEDMRKERAEHKNKSKSTQPLPTLDMSAAESFSRTDFDAALRKVSRRSPKPSRPDRASRET